MGQLSRNDERAVKLLAKRAEKLEQQAEYQIYPRHRREKLQAAHILRAYIEKLTADA